MTQLILEPYYKTDLGTAYLGDSKELMKQIPDESIDLICTSPQIEVMHQLKEEFTEIFDNSKNLGEGTLKTEY